MIFSSKNRKIGSFAMDCIKFWAANTILSILSLAGGHSRLWTKQGDKPKTRYFRCLLTVGKYQKNAS